MTDLFIFVFFVFLSFCLSIHRCNLYLDRPRTYQKMVVGYPHVVFFANLSGIKKHGIWKSTIFPARNVHLYPFISLYFWRVLGTYRPTFSQFLPCRSEEFPSDYSLFRDQGSAGDQSHHLANLGDPRSLWELFSQMSTWQLTLVRDWLPCVYYILYILYIYIYICVHTLYI